MEPFLTHLAVNRRVARNLGDIAELKSTLLDLKAKRETLEAKGHGDHPYRAATAFDTTRRVLHSYVYRIEIDPKAKRGTLILTSIT